MNEVLVTHDRRVLGLTACMPVPDVRLTVQPIALVVLRWYPREPERGALSVPARMHGEPHGVGKTIDAFARVLVPAACPEAVEVLERAVEDVDVTWRFAR